MSPFIWGLKLQRQPAKACMDGLFGPSRVGGCLFVAVISIADSLDNSGCVL